VKANQTTLSVTGTAALNCGKPCATELDSLPCPVKKLKVVDARQKAALKAVLLFLKQMP